jgi:pimeloyl-ACP methyl ester carboxylesterase
MGLATVTDGDWRLEDAEPASLTVDGRRVAYTTYGDPTGRSVVFCHGTPGSRLLGYLLSAPAAERGVRLVAPDRPGIGGSDDAPVTIDDWPADVAALLAHLDVEDAGVIGFSGGSAFALACHRLDAVDHVTLVSGSGPPGVGQMGRAQRTMGTRAGYAPWLLAPLVRLQRRILARQDSSAALDLVADDAPETDALSTDEIARLVKADVLAATADGPGVVVRELGLLAKPWPVDLGDVSVPVTVFQGERDTNVAPATGEALVRRLPEATLERVDSDHLGTLCDAAPRVLRGPTLV